MDSGTDSEYEVDRIVGKRKSKGKVEYLVQWKGYSKGNNSWEPFTNLMDCSEKIAEYLYVKQQLEKKTMSQIQPSNFYVDHSPKKVAPTSPVKPYQLRVNDSPHTIVANQIKSPVVSLCKLDTTNTNQPRLDTKSTNQRRPKRLIEKTKKPKNSRVLPLRSNNAKNKSKPPPTKSKVPTSKVKPIRKVAVRKVFTLAKKKDVIGEWLDTESSQIQDVVLDHDYLDVNVISAIGHRNTSEDTEASAESKLKNQPLIPGGIKQKRFVYLSWNQDYVEIIFANTTRGNALTPRFLLEISKALDAVISSKCSTALLRSVGPIFSLGFDLQAVVDFLLSSCIRDETARNLAESIRNFINKLIDFPKMLVAIVQGPCVGLACSMLSHFDAVYCSDRSVFWTPYTEMGITPDGCSSLLFPEIMGKSMANSMLLSSTKLTAKQAKERGLVTDVFVHDNLQTNAIGLITKSSSQSAEIMEKTKSLIRSPHVTRLKHANYCEANQLMEVLSKKNAPSVMKQFLSVHWYC